MFNLQDLTDRSCLPLSNGVQVINFHEPTHGEHFTWISFLVSFGHLKLPYFYFIFLAKKIQMGSLLFLVIDFNYIELKFAAFSSRDRSLALRF